MPKNEFCRNCNRPLPHREKPEDTTPRWYKAGSGWTCSEFCCERALKQDNARPVFEAPPPMDLRGTLASHIPRAGRFFES